MSFPKHELHRIHTNLGYKCVLSTFKLEIMVDIGNSHEISLHLHSVEIPQERGEQKIN